MSNFESVFDGVKTVILEATSVTESAVHLDASIREDLGADSLDSIEIVMALEDKFGVQLSEEAAEKIRTVNDLVEFVLSAQGKKAAAVG